MAPSNGLQEHHRKQEGDGGFHNLRTLLEQTKELTWPSTDLFIMWVMVGHVGMMYPNSKPSARPLSGMPTGLADAT